MKVSASILAVKDNYLEYAEQLSYSNVDYLHVDIFQDSEEFGIGDLTKFSDTFLPLDIHLIFETISERDISILNSVQAEYVNVQFETLRNKDECIELSKRINARFGIAITADTPLDVVERYKDYISQVLFMCSEPGVSGARFDERNFARVKEIHDKYPFLHLVVDGGINNIIGEQMGKIGASMVVSGSYLCKDLCRLDANAYMLKYMNEQNIKLGQCMIPAKRLPITYLNGNFEEIINMMNKYRLGVVFVEEDGKFAGIISDGDIRRGFLKYNKDIFVKYAKDLLNEKPYTAARDGKLQEIYEELAHVRKGVDIIPIVENEVLIGAVDLHRGV